MSFFRNRATQIALGAGLFLAGAAAGSLHARSGAVQNHFGQPKTAAGRRPIARAMRPPGNAASFLL